MSALTQPLPAPMHIRFVNTQGEPPLKRRRINSACLACRRRKTRCAGERPSCSTCEKNGLSCPGYTDIVETKNDYNGTGDSTREGPSETRSRGKGATSDAKKESDGPAADELLDDERHASSESDTDDDNDVTRSGPSEIYHDKTAGDASNKGGSRNNSDGQIPRRLDSGPALTQGQTASHTLDSEWEHGIRHSPRKSQQQKQKNIDDSQRPQDYHRPVPFYEDSHESHGSHAPRQSPSQQHQHHNESHRVPYFRYFGPTAIVPGYKQMVVDVSVRDRRRSRGSSLSTSSPSTVLTDTAANHPHGHNSRQSATTFEPLFESLDSLPVYDPNDSEPVHPLIINLIKTFFVHLGCNYPFLRQKQVMRLVQEKRLEPILVDAMCALSARFSDLPIFTNETDNGKDNNGGQGQGRMARSEYGHVFAQRAKAATVDTFPCPSVAAVQACLLMAYEGFGADQDSALWMYLGIAIRMAVDLGLQKKVDVTAQREKDPWFMCSWSEKHGSEQGNESGKDTGSLDNPFDATRESDGRNDQVPAIYDDSIADVAKSRGDDSFEHDDILAEAQERADTFWAVFFLDRVISSGTGRPVTFRDDDFELALPQPILDPQTDWPAPFPILAQIIHLYGRVSDVLNNIRSANDLTQEKMQKLGHMENDLTQLYQKQDPRLNFNASNFQTYVRVGQGTTFILLHFWFHALIIILHQPTLLTPFGGLRRMHQLLPNSHELSMSSAKTIADILAFAELIDPKSFVGNPFTSQPMYIAACAFLMESIANASLPVSRNTTPPPSDNRARGAGAGAGKSSLSSKHSLLASNANQNYQRCYKSLQQLHIYWGGVRYILSALDQKAKGIWDCETFTSDELESTGQPTRDESLKHMPRFDNTNSPKAPPIAWSLTGTSNSANPSVTLLYQNLPNARSSVQANTEQMPRHQKQRQQRLQKQQKQRQQHTHQPVQNDQSLQTSQPSSAATPPGNMIYDPIRQSLPEIQSLYPTTAYPQANLSAIRYFPHSSSQPQQQPQQQYTQHPSSSFLGDIETAQGPNPHAYKYDHLHQGAMDTASPRSDDGGIYASDEIAYHGQHFQRQGYVQQQQRGDMGQVPLPSSSIPAAVHSYNTPPSLQPSSYDGAVLPSTLPPQNRLAEFGQPHVGAGVAGDHNLDVHAAAAAAGMGHLDGSVLHQHQQGDFGQNVGASGSGLVGDPYSYLGTGPMTDVITFDSHEIDISSLPLPTDIMPQWLEYLPSNVLHLFDENLNGADQ